MTIEIKKGELVVEADNVKIVKTVFESIYAEKEDGSKDFSRRLGEDVLDEALSLLSQPLEDLIYYRKADYDSLSLILQLYRKLPADATKGLFDIIKEDFDS